MTTRSNRAYGQLSFSEDSPLRNLWGWLLTVIIVIITIAGLAHSNAESSALPTYSAGDDSSRRVLDFYVERDGSAHAIQNQTYTFGNTVEPVTMTLSLRDYFNNTETTIEKMSVTCENGVEQEIPELNDSNWTNNSPYILYQWEHPENPTFLEDTKKHISGFTTDIDTNWLLSLDSFYVRTNNEDESFTIYNRWDNRTCTVTTTYSIDNAIGVYDNASVFYLGEDLWNAYDMTIFDATIHFPVPENESVKDKVFIAGEMPDIRYKKTVENNNTISLSATLGEKQKTGVNFYIAFPRHWSHVPDGNANVIHENYDYVFEGAGAFPSKTRLFDRFTRDIWIFGGLFTVIGILLLVSYKRKYRAVFNEKYWSDVPDKNLHPAVVSRIWAWNRKKQTDKDIPVILMHLAAIGAVRLVEKGSETGVSRYELERVAQTTADLTTLDIQVLNLIFQGSTRSVSLESLQRRFTDKTEIKKIKRSIEKLVDAQIDRIVRFRDFTLPRAWRIFFAVLAVFYALAYLSAVLSGGSDGGDVAGASTFLVVSTLSTILAIWDYLSMKEGFGYRLVLWAAALLIGWATYYQYSYIRWGVGINGDMAVFVGLGFVLLFVLFGILTLRPPSNVRELIAKSDALKRWLEDFTLLDEKPPSDVKVWGELMVYATAFGVADTTLAQIDKALPNVSNDSVFEKLAAWVKKDDNTAAPFDLLVSVFSERNR